MHMEYAISSALFLWQHRTDYNSTFEKKRMMRIFSAKLSANFVNLVVRELDDVNLI